MKIVISRKGFDSGSGGYPSPIIDGQPVSLPIPTRGRSNATYASLALGEIVERVTKGKIGRTHLCHDDPMFVGDCCYFGQTGAAQSHLANQGVGVGDVFLFFGLFADEHTGTKHHRIYAYMKVERVIPLGAHPKPSEYASLNVDHPHFSGEWNSNNTLYVGAGRKAAFAHPRLRLTQEDGPTSIWLVPDWLRTKGLTYHGKPERWLPGNHLQSVAKGQEFVTHIGSDPAALNWLEEKIRTIEQGKSSDRGNSVGTEPIIIVMLRQPRKNDPNERRSDPFWEFGSFGCTGCHRRNLMNPKRIAESQGARLAFVQGGAGEFRLVHLTPPVTVKAGNGVSELQWSGRTMPFRYERAPVMIANNGFTDFPALLPLIDSGRRATPVGQFSSNFRSRRVAVNDELASQIEAVWRTHRADPAAIAERYEDALPYPPPLVDLDRAATYRGLTDRSPDKMF